MRGKRKITSEDEENTSTTTKKIKYDLDEVLKLLKDENPEFIKELWAASEENIEVFNHMVYDAFNRDRDPVNPEDVMLTCECCYDEELPLLESVECDKGLHTFCKECVKKNCEITVANADAYPKCMAEHCTGVFAVNALELVIPQQLQQNLLQKQQLEEVNKAEVDGLESCPFCYFAYVPGRDDPEFICLSPHCTKKSCRRCKKISHAPKPCEDEAALAVEHKVEEAMTEALICKCPGCGKEIVKVDGCNKLTCICGTYMCYICKKKITGYDHFREYGFNPLACSVQGGTRTDADITAAGKKVRDELEPSRDFCTIM